MLFDLSKLGTATRLYLSGAVFVVIFIVAIVAFERSNNSFIEFAQQEKLGNEYQKPVMNLLHGVIGHRNAFLRQTNEYGEVEKEINSSFSELIKMSTTTAIALQFTPEGLRSRKRENLVLDKVKAKWDALQKKAKSSSYKDMAEDYTSIISDIRGMIAHAGDTSNLILDPDLDSYYLMDITLLALPQTIDRLGSIYEFIYQIKNSPEKLNEDSNKLEMAIRSRMLEEADLGRVMADFDTVFKEDPNFYGVSPTLKKSLEPLITKYQEANKNLIEKLKDISKNKENTTELVENISVAIESANDLWKGSDTELDNLLDLRIASYFDQKIRVIAFNSVALLFALIFFYFIIRSVVRPIKLLINCIISLTAGNKNADIPGLNWHDELGMMSKALMKFKETILLTERLTEEQKVAQQKAIEEKHKSMQELANKFEDRVKSIIQTVMAASTELYHTSQSLTTIMEEANKRIISVKNVSENASHNVNTVASAAEEMSASVKEIAEQVSKSSTSVKSSVLEVDKTDRTSSKLEESAQKIGNVTQLIQEISEQINLLALNATIESARAGEAGKGFAVVASEVKTLAGETTSATDEIAQYVSSIQEVSNQVIKGLQSIKDIISDVEKYSSAITTAVEEQSAATREIASSMLTAASGTSQISKDILEVNKASDTAKKSSEQVLEAARMLSIESEKLNKEVTEFISEIRVA